MTLLIVLACRGPAAAQKLDPRPTFVGVRVGFDGAYKLGYWTPVEVYLRAGRDKLTGHLDLIVLDGDGAPTRVTTAGQRRFEIPPGETQALRAYVKFGQEDAELTAEFYDDRLGRLRWTFAGNLTSEPEQMLPPPIAQSQELWVGVGPSIGIGETIKRLTDDEGRAAVNAVQLPDTSGLPTRWYGYEGVDWLVIATSNADIFRELSPEGAQAAALEQWVAQGGKVLICAGAGAAQALTADRPLARLLPGRFERTEARQGFDAVRIGSAIETYADARSPVTGLSSADQASATLDVPLFADFDGTALVRSGETPLVIRTAHGFGQVTLVGLDLDRPPWSNWSGRASLVGKLLGKPTHVAPSAVATMQPGNPYGINDLSGQLSDCLAQFPNVKFVSFWIIALLIAGYILLIGPGDYFLVKRVFKRIELTWLTSSLIILLVSLGAYFFALWLKGDALHLNQVDVVDVDTRSGMARGTTWANIFSPRMRTYDVGLAPQALDNGSPPPHQMLLSWLGTPGEVLGTMGNSAQGLWNRPYAFRANLEAIVGLPIQVWSTKAVTGRWQAQTGPLLEGSLTLAADESVAGTLTNRCRLTLHKAWLAAGARAYELGELAPGASVNVTRATHWLALRSWLTGKEAIYDDDQQEAIQQGGVFNVAQLDMPNTVRRMMFFEAAGGAKATHLTNDYQNHVDLSGHLELQRAIVLAEIDGAAAELRDGEQPLQGQNDQHWTYIRFVLPLEPAPVDAAGQAPGDTTNEVPLPR
ncbi:MAG: hypothetical protein K1X74_18570 [Pirellulales bacterium]|nr:hypothetical protein [Pirellulales bacterium]